MPDPCAGSLARNVAIRLGPIFLFLMSAGPLRADPAQSLIGTWGVPPDDTNRFVNGSYFSVYREESGALAADANLEPGQWHCGFHHTLSWNQAQQRFEWPDGGGGQQACWIKTAPAGQSLRLTIKCAYQCTDSAHEHALELERISDMHLHAPEGTGSLFCPSHNALRQALCSSAPLQDAVGRARKAAEKLREVGGDEKATEFYGDTKHALLPIIEACADTACLKSRIDAATNDMEASAAERQRTLAAERAASEAARIDLVETEDRNAWVGQRMLSNEKFVSTLSIEKCIASGCVASIDATTNYTFGYSQRRGGCEIDNVETAFTSTNAAFGYAVNTDEEHPEGNTPFANYCRIDLRRSTDGIVLATQGPGCGSRCENVAGEYALLQGTYATLQRPSFDCKAKDLSEYRWDEQLICLDAQLAARDRELETAYVQAKAKAKQAQRRALVKTQQDWIAQREQACERAERTNCLRSAYEARLRQLSVGFQEN